MQKDIQKSKGETQQQREQEPSKEANKVKEIGHNINASLKENLGVGFGNTYSQVDREKANENKELFEEKKIKEEREKDFEKKRIILEKKLVGETNLESSETGTVSHKIQEVGHNINANLKENIGFGIGDYPSEVDREKATEHREKYDDKVEKQKEKLKEKAEELKERVESGETGIYAHRLQEVGHNINATLKENIGVGLGDYSSEVDHEKATEHREKYDEKVKEESKPEVGESTSLGHKLKEVAHTVNANLKEMIGIGLGNYSSEVDRELAHIHKEKYEEMTNTTDNKDNIEELEVNKDEKEKENEKEKEKEKKKEKEKEKEKEKKKEKESKTDEFKSKESKQEEFSKQKSGFGDNKL